MELRAFLSILFFIFKNKKNIKPGDNINIYSDSTYVVKNYNLWLDKWVKKNKLCKRKNYNLWFIIYIIKRAMINNQIKINVHWVKAHHNNYWNNLVDKFCNDKLRGM